MPYHLSTNGLNVLNDKGQTVPGGTHPDKASALKHLQALNIAYRREEGKPVAPKMEKAELTQEQRDELPASDFVDPERKRFPIKDASDVMDAVQSYGRADPKIPYEQFKRRLTAIAKRKGFESSLPKEWTQEKPEEKAQEEKPIEQPKPQPEKEKASWLADPTDEDLYQFLVNEDIDPYLGISKATQPELQDSLFVDRTWHETPLPDIEVRAHPYGNIQKRDAHEEYFDPKTNFHNDLLTSIPVSYYHNYNPDGTPSGEPIAIGKTVARRYANDGRWDKIHFDENMPPKIKARLVKAIQTKSLRASPTVVPDFHRVDDRTGHIDDWLTGSIAVLDASGDRQPANRLAIGLPAMKALFKQAQIQFPKSLEAKTKMGNTTKASLKARFKAMLKAMLDDMDQEEETPEGEAEFHSHPDGTSHANHEGSEQEHTHDEKGAMKAVIDPNPLSAITESGRFDGADPDKQMKAEREELARAMEEPRKEDYRNELGEGDVRLDWSNQQKTMKAEIAQLRMQNDLKEFDTWSLAQMQSGKLLPADLNDVRTGYLLALRTDRTQHPTMKAKGLSMLKLYKQSIERRPSLFGEQSLDENLMKAFRLSGFDHPQKRDPDAPIPEEEWVNSSRRKELLRQTDMGQLALKNNGGKNA